MKKNKFFIHRLGFTLMEGILTISIVAVLVGLGSRILLSSFNNFVTQREFQKGLAENNIIYDRVVYSYLNPLFRIFYKPLYLSSDGTITIFATSKTAFDQLLIDNKTHISQIVRLDKKTDNTLQLTQFIPPDSASDTLYDDTTDFLSITNASTLASTQTLVENLNQFSIHYFDMQQNQTTDKASIANIAIDLSLTRNQITLNRSAVISPWKLLWQ